MEKIIDNQSEKKITGWPIILLNISLTNKQLIEELKTKTPEERAEIFAQFQQNDKKKLPQKKETHTEKESKYTALEPLWFEFAPDSVKRKREEIKTTDNIEELQWIHDNVSYNIDGTMNIIKLKKIFNKDISWIDKKCNWKEAKQLAVSKWYTLPTDYNDDDSDEVKHNSDWYTVINVFSDGKWDTVEGMELFRDLAWCNNRYWTATEYKNDKWEKLEGVARRRRLNESYCYRYWGYTYGSTRVCGFKPAP